MHVPFLPRILVFFAALAFCKAIEAAPTAFDAAGDSAYNNGWTAGSNGGYGWNGGWDFKYVGMMTPTLASDPADGGIMNSPASPLGRAWKVTSNNAYDSLPARHIGSALQPGQVISVDVDCAAGYMIFGFADAQGDYIVLSSGPLVPNGPNDYDLEYYERLFSFPPPSFEDADVPAFSGPVQIALTALSMSRNISYFNLQITSLTSGQSETIPSLDIWSDGYPLVVDTFYFGASGPSSVVYFNNISITPEPAALGAASIWSLLLLKRRRNRRASEIV